MGIKKFIIGSIVTTAVSTAVKLSNDKKEEKVIETEANKEIVREQELTKRMMIEEQSQARKYQQLSAIKEERDANPISIDCPLCNGKREIDRIKGIVKCPYCDNYEPLPSVHMYNADIDTELNRQVNASANDVQNNKLKIEAMAKTSFILGIISLCTLGILIVTECIGLYFGIKLVKNENGYDIEPEVMKKAIKGTIFNAVALIIVIITMIM